MAVRVLFTITVLIALRTPTAAAADTWLLRLSVGEKDNAAGVSRIVAHVADTTVAYATLTASGRLFRTDDRGETWVAVGEVAGVRDIATDPRDQDSVFIATGRGLLRSSDRGRSWVELGHDTFANPPDPASVSAVAINPNDASAIYASAGGSPPGILKSNDGGHTWIMLLAEHAAGQFAFDAADPLTVYARMTYPEADSGVAVSHDGGATWRLGSFNFVSTMAASPRDTGQIWSTLSVYLCNTLWVSNNAGMTWRPTEISGCAEGPAERTPTAIAVDPRDSRIVYVGTQGAGVLWTTDGGTSWQPFNDGLAGLRVTALAADGASSQLIVGTAELAPLGWAYANIYTRPLPTWPPRRRAVRR